ncbi:MAG: hypothetical protein ACXWUG_31605, partial [Polyangiales bacterium]
MRVALCATMLLWASVASANSAAIRTPPPATATSPQLPTKTTLRVTHEELSFDCDREGLDVRCRFEARYRIENPTEKAESVVAAFYGIEASDVVVRIDGVAAKRALGKDEEALLDEGVRASIEQQEIPRDTTRTGFALSLAPKAKTEVVVTGVMLEEEYEHSRSNHGWMIDAVDVRHLALRTTREGLRWRFRYFLAPLRTWAGTPEIHVRVRGPRGLARVGGPSAEGDPRFQETVEDGREVVTGVFDQGTYPSTLEFGFDDPSPKIRNGGVVLGLGSVDKQFRLRLGYEIASPRWVLYSANVDFDFRGKVILAPAVTFATPGILILPSLGLGAGLPVQVAPSVHV